MDHVNMAEKVASVVPDVDQAGATAVQASGPAPAVSRSELLVQTAQYGRCQREPDRAASDSPAISAIPTVGDDPQTKAQVIGDRLAQVQRLKAHYTALYQACLAHMPVAAASLHKAGHPVVQTQPAKRPRAPDDIPPPSTQAQADMSQHASGALTPLGPAVSKASTAQATLLTEAALPTPLQTFAEAEAALLGSFAAENPPSPRAAKQQAAELGSTWSARLGQLSHELAGIADHERMAAGAATADMDERDACAVLCGSQHRFYVHQGVVLVGRESKSKGEVDVNLLLEQKGLKVSRLQCLLEMDLSYGFVLRNIGRQCVCVNGIDVHTGKKVKVPHLSLIKIGGVQLLFVMNIQALQRACLQQPPLPKQSVGF